jgi:serine/threonine protein kinase
MNSLVDTWRIDLVRELARGGMSLVYEGRLHGSDGFEKTVAVKMMLDAWGENERFMQLCAAEARLVSDLVHENIVQIHQLGRTPAGQYYVVMEYVHGLPLRHFLDHHRMRNLSVPVPLAVHIASRIARGLAYAHSFHDEQGACLHIVHRDVCPSNILITTEGLAKLTDFGVAKATSMTLLDGRWLTGKVPYMSPEQAACGEVDFRADQFSLAAVLFELICGEPIRDPRLDPGKNKFSEMDIPWDKLPADLDGALRDVLERALHPDPGERYERTADMATALEFVIYRDGYGPTIQTVEAYMRKQFPYLYLRGAPAPDATPAPAADAATLLA